MSGAGLKIFELILLPGLVFAWGFWELHKLKQHKRQREAERVARQKEEADMGEGRPAAS